MCSSWVYVQNKDFPRQMQMPNTTVTVVLDKHMLYIRLFVFSNIPYNRIQEIATIPIAIANTSQVST